MKIKYFFYLIGSLCFSACTGNGTPDKGNGQTSGPKDTTGISKDNGATKPEAVIDNRPIYYLEGLYATSTAEGSDVRYAFDDDPKTIWKTIAGAGPDEGIMIYFPMKRYVNQIKIQAATDTQFSKILDLSVFVNGTPVSNGGVNQKIDIEQGANSIYIRFLTTENLESKELLRDGNGITINTFSKNHQLGIEDIFLYGKDGEAYRIVPPRLIRGKIIASSTLAPQAAYNAAQLFDSRKEFAWVEGESHDGKGETIQLELEEETKINGLKLWNGYQRSTGHFQKNGRVKKLGFGDGKNSKTFTFRDSPAGQKIPLGLMFSSKNFELQIEDIYKGTAYQDLAISELLFFDGKEPLVVRSDFVRKTQQKYREKAKGTSLEACLDSRIYNLIGTEMFELERSLILRSDGTFVNYAYSYNEGDDDEVKSISDGNWEILEANEKEVKLKLFGKFFDYSNMEAYYKGAAADEMTRIFKDVVRIKDGKLQGEKYIDALYLE